jgi:carbon starvation protein
VRSLPANVLASGLVVGLWGYFLVAAVYDPDGGIKALWPIFGIANQLLASTALCLATTVILKMALQSRTGVPSVRGAGGTPALRSPALALITFVPLLWLLTVTSTAAVQKIWHSDPRIGFLAQAEAMTKRIESLKAQTAGVSETALPAHQKLIAQTAKQMGNAYLDAVVTGFFLALVAGIFLLSVREWVLLLARKKAAEPRETPPVWLPDYAVAEAKPFQLFSFLALSLALLRELSGEAAVDRAQQHPAACRGTRQVALLEGGLKPPTRAEAYAVAVEHRFRGPNRCC